MCHTRHCWTSLAVLTFLSSFTGGLLTIYVQGYNVLSLVVPSPHGSQVFLRTLSWGPCFLASYPGPFEKSEKRAWYQLFAHALNFPTFREFRIIPWYLRVSWRCTHTLPYIYSYTADNGCTDSAVLYALLRLRGEARVLKLEKKASMKRLSWLLMDFGK